MRHDVSSKTWRRNLEDQIRASCVKRHPNGMGVFAAVFGAGPSKQGLRRASHQRLAACLQLVASTVRSRAVELAALKVADPESEK